MAKTPRPRQPRLHPSLEPTIWFVDEKMKARPLCQKKHKDASKCSRHHEVPEGVFWSGDVGESKGDFLVVLSEKRREFRRSFRKWERRMARMTAKKAAPTFRAYLDSLIEKHKTAMPVFSFSWNCEPIKVAK